MKHSDVEELARKAGISVARRDDIEYDPYKVSALNLEHFAALVLEKAADHCDTHYNHEAKDCADELRAMSAALQSGDRG